MIVITVLHVIVSYISHKLCKCCYSSWCECYFIKSPLFTHFLKYPTLSSSFVLCYPAWLSALFHPICMPAIFLIVMQISKSWGLLYKAHFLWQPPAIKSWCIEKFISYNFTLKQKKKIFKPTLFKNQITGTLCRAIHVCLLLVTIMCDPLRWNRKRSNK